MKAYQNPEYRLIHGDSLGELIVHINAAQASGDWQIHTIDDLQRGQKAVLVRERRQEARPTMPPRASERIIK